MLILALVMNGMVRWADHPRAQPVMGKAQGSMVEADVIHHGPDGHGCQYGENRAKMQGDEASNANKKYCMGHGFYRVKGE